MKVLFATDGSPEDQQARGFISAAPWPSGTEIELFGVVRQVPFAASGVFVESRAQDLPAELEHLATSLPAGDSVVTWRWTVGEPVEMITARARAIEADLIVVGSRGRGAVATSILGSVSAGVIDHAPCPVLVARRREADRIVVADDGSAGAATAAAFLDAWPIFNAAALMVVTVVDVGRPLSPMADVPVMYPAGEHAYIESLREACAHAQQTVVRRSKALWSGRRSVATSVRVGDPADEILAAANDAEADLIVVGSRGQTGLARFFAGSVARRVLLDSTCSVLIARGSAGIVHDRAPVWLTAFGSPRSA
jgi:nucleotide-binding universal stress UspA family protein